MSIFNKIQMKKPSASVFDLSHDVKLSFKMGYLIPTLTQECVPGDKFHVSSEAMFRMMPMIAPIMHKVDIYQHFFFVPNRLVWPNWEEWITGGADGNPAIAFPVMNLGAMSAPASSLADYLGLPIGTAGNYLGSQLSISALPFMAYQQIYHQYYRDQNLESPEQYNPPVLTDGTQSIDVTAELLELRKRAWEHDYFTSALPFAQKGEAVEIPIDLQGTSTIELDPDVNDYGRVVQTDGMPNAANADMFAGGPGLDSSLTVDDGGSGTQVKYDPNNTLRAVFNDDVTTTTTINDLRTAFSLQKWLEKNARAGSRYIESILAHFGVRSSDARLNRPEYLGGSRASMAISEVLQTSQTSETPQGNMAGHGIGISGGRDFSYRCEEHGYIMGILSIRPKTAYYQGLPRHFSKNDRMMYYWPDFAFLGEQNILNKEIYVDFATPANNNDTFGYIPRYSEYRYNPSRVSGQMRTSLEFWHMGRDFASLPALNAEFIQCNPTKRVFAVEDPTEDEIIGHIYHKIRARRPLPKYGNPGSI